MVEVLRQSPVAMLVRRRRKQARRGPSRLSVAHASLRGIVCPQSLRCLRVAEFYSDCRYAPPPDGGIRSEPTRHPLGAIVFTGHPDTGTHTGGDRSHHGGVRGASRRASGIRASLAAIDRTKGALVCRRRLPPQPPWRPGWVARKERRKETRNEPRKGQRSCRFHAARRLPPARSTAPSRSDCPKTTLAGQSGHPCGTRAARERIVEGSQKDCGRRAQGLQKTRRSHFDGGSAGVQTKALLSPFGVPGGPATAVQTPTVRKHAPHRARLGRTSCQLVDCRILTDALCRITHL